MHYKTLAVFLATCLLQATSLPTRPDNPRPSNATAPRGTTIKKNLERLIRNANILEKPAYTTAAERKESLKTCLDRSTEEYKSFTGSDATPERREKYFIECQRTLDKQPYNNQDVDQIRSQSIEQLRVQQEHWAEEWAHAEEKWFALDEKIAIAKTRQNAGTWRNWFPYTTIGWRIYCAVACLVAVTLFLWIWCFGCCCFGEGHSFRACITCSGNTVGGRVIRTGI